MNSYLALFQNINSGKFTQAEINYYVESSYKIATEYVSHVSTKIKKQVLSDNLILEDIAIESIAPLFETDSRGCFIKLHDAFERYSSFIDTESDAMYFLNKIIAKKVDQNITLTLRNSDPLFSQILDSIKYYYKKEGYYKINFFGTYYITESPDYNSNNKIISCADFDVLPFYLFENSKYVLRQLINYLKNETNYYPAIPLNSLVLRLKNFYSINESNQKSQPVQFHLKFETTELVKIGLERASDKLECSYYKKGKLNLNEKEAFLKVLNLIADELINGGTTPGLYKYLNMYMKNLTKENYTAKYRNILEYLIKVMKSTIVQKISA